MSDNNEIKKPAKAIERVTVSESLKPKLQALCDQANESLQGMATVSKSDVVNLMLEEHDSALSEKELRSLRTAHFDEVRFAQWMANHLKQARSNGEAVSMADLIERSRNLFGSQRARTPRRKRVESKSSEESKETQDI